MPLLNNKRFPLKDPIPYDPKRKRKEVWYLRCTNEIFTNYEDYINRMTLYKQPIWKCELTGRQDLTYEQALESEGCYGYRAEELFCKELRRRMLLRIQFQSLSLDALVEDLYNHFSSHFDKNEIVHFVLDDDNVYMARILDVLPQMDTPPANGDARHTPLPDPLSDTTESDEDTMPRQANGRLRFPDAFLHPTPKNDKTTTDSTDTSHTRAPTRRPTRLRYRIQLIDHFSRPLEDHLRIIDSSEIRRDAHSFRRPILRRFIRECAYRDSHVGAPWHIKKSYGESTTFPSMAPETHVFTYNPRKRRAPKSTDERDAEKRARKEETLLHKAMLKEQKERLRQERRKQAAVKYPMEDLDLPIYRKDPKQDWMHVDTAPDTADDHCYTISNPSGGRPPRPIPHKGSALPVDLFESALAVWLFLAVFSEHIRLKPCSMDEFERALLDSSRLLVDCNACLLNVIIDERDEDESDEIQPRQRSTQSSEKEGEDSSMTDEKDERCWRDEQHLKLCERWDRKLVRADRKGWDIGLIGFLNYVATPEDIPALDEILHHLVPHNRSTPIERERQYTTLDVRHKLAILSFLVDSVTDSELVKDCIEECQEQLVDLRRQKVELNKESKSLSARRLDFDRREQADREKEVEEEQQNGKDHDKDEEEGELSSDESRAEDSDVDEDGSDHSGDSDSGERIVRRRLSRQEKLKRTQRKRAERDLLRRKLYEKQREAAKVRSQELRQKAEERQKLEDEERALRKKEEQLERTMQKYMLLRMQPLGRDRFYNRYIYLDNIGTPNTYGTGRLYVQSPSDVDILMIMERGCSRGDTTAALETSQYGLDHTMMLELMRYNGFDEECSWLKSRMEQLQTSAAVGKNYAGWWKCYSKPEEILQLLAWLNPKGVREQALKMELEKQQPCIIESMEKRVQVLAKKEEALAKAEKIEKRVTRGQRAANSLDA